VDAPTAAAEHAHCDNSTFDEQKAGASRYERQREQLLALVQNFVRPEHRQRAITAVDSAAPTSGSPVRCD